MKWRAPAASLAGMATALASQAALADRLGQAPDDGPSIWRVAGAFSLCALFAFAGALVLRSRGGLGALSWLRPATARRLTLVESVRLTPQVQLCIVVCDGREMLLTTAPTGAILLRELGPAEPRGAKA
jgi:hypothetical protein